MSGYLQNFDLTNGLNILGIICGAFFHPAHLGEILRLEALKFKPPAT